MRSDGLVVLAVSAAQALRAASGPAASQPAVDAIVTRASAYVVQYESALGGLVAEEDYTQQVSMRTPSPTMVAPRRTRRLKSDFMLVKFTAAEPWIPFRDVIAVDGKPVGDRDARLEELFLKPEAQARQNAARITDEGARYNLGSMHRNINVPTLALEYLKPGNAARCRLGAPHRETVDGQAAWKIEYAERDGPTVIKDGRNGGDVPANGVFWIRDTDGAVMRSILRTKNRISDLEIDVKYCQAPAVPVLVPCRMSERYNLSREQVTGVATYANIRQFKVTTTESIKH
jgi:hypothetical protein